MNEEHLDALHIRQMDEITRMKVENSIMKKQLYYLKKIPVREEKLQKQLDIIRKKLHSSGYKTWETESWAMEAATAVAVGKAQEQAIVIEGLQYQNKILTRQADLFKRLVDSGCINLGDATYLGSEDSEDEC